MGGGVQLTGSDSILYLNTWGLDMGRSYELISLNPVSPIRSETAKTWFRPIFSNCSKVPRSLEPGLWSLWVGKEKGKEKSRE